jgi:hypothetical protein
LKRKSPFIIGWTGLVQKKLPDAKQAVGHEEEANRQIPGKGQGRMGRPFPDAEAAIEKKQERKNFPEQSVCHGSRKKMKLDGTALPDGQAADCARSIKI